MWCTGTWGVSEIVESMLEEIRAVPWVWEDLLLKNRRINQVNAEGQIKLVSPNRIEYVWRMLGLSILV